MKRQFLAPVAALALLTTPIFADDKPAVAPKEAPAPAAPAASETKVVVPEKPELKDEMDKVSYSLGLNFGGGLKQAPVKMKLDLVMAGLRDSYLDKGLLSDKER